MLGTVLSISLAVISMAAPAIASAAPAGDPHTRMRSQNQVVVSVTDIDFNRPEAVDTLYARLQYASKVACDTLEAEEPFRAADNRACERDAVDGAVHDLGQPLLTARHVRAQAQQVATREERR